MKKQPSFATIDDDFAQIEKLLKELRNRIAQTAETVRIASGKSKRRV